MSCPIVVPRAFIISTKSSSSRLTRISAASSTDGAAASSTDDDAAAGAAAGAVDDDADEEEDDAGGGRGGIALALLGLAFFLLDGAASSTLYLEGGLIFLFVDHTGLCRSGCEAWEGQVRDDDDDEILSLISGGAISSYAGLSHTAHCNVRQSLLSIA